MIQIILFVIAVSAYENYEGCSTKTFNYTEYGYSDVEDLYNQFTCEGASLSYNPLPVTNNTIYDLYDLYYEFYNNEDYDIYDAEWNTTDIFGCACGIGACVNEEKTNITAPDGQITCQCAPGSYMNLLQRKCVCQNKYKLRYNEEIKQWECYCQSGIDDGHGNCYCANNQYWDSQQESCECKESLVMYKSDWDGQCYCKLYNFGGQGVYCWLCHICVGILVLIAIGAVGFLVLGCFGITLCCTADEKCCSRSSCCCCKQSETEVSPEVFVMEKKPDF